MKKIAKVLKRYKNNYSNGIHALLFRMCCQFTYNYLKACLNYRMNKKVINKIKILNSHEKDEEIL